MPPPSFRSALPDIAWPALPSAASGNLLALQFQFERSERQPPADRAASQAIQREKLITHAHDALPFWRARLRKAGWQPGTPLTETLWRALPILTRAEAQAAGTRLHCQAVPETHGTVRAATTSGSTGRPLTALKTDVSLFFWHGAVLREALWHGLDLSGTLAIIRRDPENKAHPPAGRATEDWGPSYATAFHTGPGALLDVRAAIPDQLAWLVARNPTYLRTWPSNLLALARAAQAAGTTLPALRAVLTFGEAVSDELRAACRAAWGVELVDAYSAEEVGYIALQCPANPPQGHPHYHVLDESMLVEVLDQAGAPCAPGQPGRVVLTPLHNYAMPLIRYEIGDYAELGQPCDCGRTLPVLTRILGRARNRIVLPNGERRFVANLGNFSTLAAGALIQQYQLAQVGPEQLELRVVTQREFTQVEAAELTSALENRYGARFNVRIAYRQSIPRAASGKYEDFVCELD